MPNIPEEVRQSFNTPSFQQLHRYYQKILRRNRFKGNPTRSLDANQLEYAHDSSAYRPPVSDPPPKKISAPTSPTDSPHYYADSPLPQPVTLPPVVYLAFDKKEADKTAQRIRNAAIVRLRNKLNATQPTESKEELPDIAERELPDAGSPPVSVAPVLQPLTEGQRVFVEVRKVTESDEGLQSVLAALLIEGLPPEDRFEEFLSQFAAWDRDEESNQLMLGLLEEVTYSNFDAIAEYSDDLPYLNEGTQDYLSHHDLDLKTRDDLQQHFEEQLKKLVPEFNNIPLHWDTLNAQGLVQVYYAALLAADSQYSHPHTPGDQEQQRSRLGEINDEINFILGLFEKIAPTPLEDSDVLIEEFGWNYAEDPIAHAIRSLDSRGEATIERLDLPLTDVWEDIDDNPLLMANVLKEILPLLIEDDRLTNGLRFEYDPYDVSDPVTDLQILTGTTEEFDLSLALFALSWVYPPAGWVLTGATIAGGVVNADWGTVGGTAADVAIDQALPALSTGLKPLNFFTEVVGHFAPDDPEYTQTEDMDVLLRQFQMGASWSNEPPEGWSYNDWEDYVNSFDPAFGPVTAEKLMTALEAVFRTEIRRELERQQ